MFLTVSTALHPGCIRKFLSDKLFAFFYTQCISFTRNARSKIIICKNENHTFRFCTQFAARLMRKE